MAPAFTTAVQTRFMVQLAAAIVSWSARPFHSVPDLPRPARSGFFFGINAGGTLYDGPCTTTTGQRHTGTEYGRAARLAILWMERTSSGFPTPNFDSSGRRSAVGHQLQAGDRAAYERFYRVCTPSNGSGSSPRSWTWSVLEEVTPPARLEVLPYVTTRAEYLSHEAADPFNDGSQLGAGIGGDLKLGIGSNLTLDATVNPDFGQVEVDPAVVNLTDVETFFEERRPFFVEGASIFEFGYGGANDNWASIWQTPASSTTVDRPFSPQASSRRLRTTHRT